MSANLDWRLTSLWFADIWSLSKNIGGAASPNNMLCNMQHVTCCAAAAGSSVFCFARSRTVDGSFICSTTSLQRWCRGLILDPWQSRECGSKLQRFGDAFRKSFPVICSDAEKHPETWATVRLPLSFEHTSRFVVIRCCLLWIFPMAQLQ